MRDLNHMSSVKLMCSFTKWAMEPLLNQIDIYYLTNIIMRYVWTFKSSQFNFRICWNSRPTWCLIHEFTSLWLHMHLSSLPRRPTMSNSVWLKSPMLALNQQTRWLSVILVMASIWHAVCCIEVMLYPKMSMLLLPPSRLRGLFSLWTGAQLDLRLVSSSAAPENIHTLQKRDWNFLRMRSGVPQEKNLMKVWNLIGKWLCYPGVIRLKCSQVLVAHLSLLCLVCSNQSAGEGG